MPINVEIKVRLSNLPKSPQEIEEIVRNHAKNEGMILKQSDTFYNVQECRLKLRLQGDGTGDLIRYHRTVQSGINVSRYEREFVDSSEEKHAEMVNRYGIKGIVRKKRKLYLVDGTRFHFDCVEGLGDFLEVEIVLQNEDEIGTGLAEARRWMETLGINEDMMIRSTYEDMLTKIESVTPADFPEIVDVWEASVRATHDFLSESDIQYLKPLILNEYLKAVELFCIREEGKILGFLGLSPDKIEMLFVRPDARGKGVGKNLARFAIYEKGIRKVDVNEQNPQAVGFYKHIGFEVVSRSPLDPQGKPFPILSMELKK